MKQQKHFLVWSLEVLIGCVAFGLISSGIFYYATASDNHTWPMLGEEGFGQWQIDNIWIVGTSTILFIILLMKEALKRRHFDLDTAEDDIKPGTFSAWFIKTLLLCAFVVLAMLGGTFLFIPAFHISLIEYWSQYRSSWIAGAIASCLTLVFQSLGQIVRRALQKHAATKTRGDWQHLAK